MLGGRDAMEILNITLVGGVRRLDEDDADYGGSRRLYYDDDTDAADADDPQDFVDATGRRLATVAYFTVTPPASRNYNAGASIVNLGPAATYTGSDPITFYGGQKFKFWFPLHEELLMLQTNEVKLYGQVFPGPDHGLQWFEHFRVVLADDTPVAHVQVKRRGSNQTSTRCSSRRLDSLELFLGRSQSPLREMQRRPMEFTAGPDVRFELNCRQQDRPLLASSRTEYMHFETPSIVFLIVAAHAGNEFPNDARLALKYQHLDLIILEMPRKQEFQGILPEIWGIRPRTAAVEAMLQPPEPSEALCQSDKLDGSGNRGSCLS